MPLRGLSQPRSKLKVSPRVETRQRLDWQRGRTTSGTTSFARYLLEVIRVLRLEPPSPGGVRPLTMLLCRRRNAAPLVAMKLPSSTLTGTLLSDSWVLFSKTASQLTPRRPVGTRKTVIGVEKPLWRSLAKRVSSEFSNAHKDEMLQQFTASKFSRVPQQE